MILQMIERQLLYSQQITREILSFKTSGRETMEFVFCSGHKFGVLSGDKSLGCFSDSQDSFCKRSQGISPSLG